MPESMAENAPTVRMKSSIHEGPVNQLARVLTNKSEKIYDYGIGNTLPNQWMKAVFNSGSASRCVDKLAKFIQANGFVDRDAAGLPVNEKQTADDLLAEIARYAALNESAFAIVVKRNIGIIGQIGSNNQLRAYCLPFETVRVGLDGRYQVNETYGKDETEYDRRAAKWYPAFNLLETPEETQAIVEEQKKPISKGGHGGYSGNVLYVFEKGPGKNIYPIPVAYSGLEDILSDASLSSLELENLEQGFFPSAMLFTAGELDDETAGKDGLTDWARFREHLNTFQSRGNRRKLMHMEFSSLETKPELIPVDSKAVLDSLDNITDRIFRKVCRHFGIPSILVEPTDSALGNGGLLLNAIQMLNAEVNPIQRLIQRTFKMLFPGRDWTISTLNLVSYLPPEVTSLLSKEQLLKMYGVAEESKENDGQATATPQTTPLVVVSPETLKAQAFLRGSVGGLQQYGQIQKDVAAGLADYQQSVNSLKIFYGFTDEETVLLLGKPKTAEVKPLIPKAT